MRRLADAFLDMGAGLALKDRYHSVLSMVADRRVAEELMAGKIPLGGELREVSVVFCDIRGYTALSAGRDPREVIDLLNQHMSALTRVVYRHHGVINQFAGDAIMILFGAPTDNENHALDAVQCAHEMLAERERLNAETHEPLGIGFGIATGKVVAGCLGSENRADYTVVGDRVNLAARLCSVAAAGEIVMDDQTRAAVPASILSTATEPLKLKGFSEPVIAHRLVS
jgi:class 3 adenylate cyclase